MGYYFERARTKKELDTEQKIRYEILRAPSTVLHPALEARLEACKAYVGPITSGEVWSALDELAQDAFVVWVLAGEDPAKVEWKNPDDLTVPQPPPTDEERRRAAEWAENFKRGLEEDRQEAARLRQQAEADWQKQHPIRHFFRQLAERLSRRWEW